jgi:hypothetical protein
MENVTKIEKKYVPVEEIGGEYILLMNSEAFYGDIDDIKERVMQYKLDGGNISDCSVGIYKPLERTEVEFKKSVKVEMDDDKYDEVEAEYFIRDGRTNKVIEEFYYEADALERLAELISDEDGREDLFNLDRKVEFACTYSVDIDEYIEINIPNQPVDVHIIESKTRKNTVEMTNEEIEEELIEMYKRLQELSSEKNKRSTLFE